MRLSSRFMETGKIPGSILRGYAFSETAHGKRGSLTKIKTKSKPKVETDSALFGFNFPFLLTSMSVISVYFEGERASVP